MLPNFQSIYFSESAAAINFPCFNSWLKIGLNDVIFSKISHGLKFYLCNNNKCGQFHEYRVKVFVLLHPKCCRNCYYNFDPCGIFENTTSFTSMLNEELEQGKLMAALNSGK